MCNLLSPLASTSLVSKPLSKRSQCVELRRSCSMSARLSRVRSCSRCVSRLSERSSRSPRPPRLRAKAASAADSRRLYADVSTSSPSFGPFCCSWLASAASICLARALSCASVFLLSARADTSPRLSCTCASLSKSRARAPSGSPAPPLPPAVPAFGDDEDAPCRRRSRRRTAASELATRRHTTSHSSLWPAFQCSAWCSLQQ
mmetsp:Transcript_19022/g.39745  ORF Transcript_19022/g.39745 Transcript_19022/m.39745 type:complete len:203 (+) Transcript_19022:176-784(+)